jgi:hypothetical protein
MPAPVTRHLAFLHMYGGRPGHFDPLAGRACFRGIFPAFFLHLSPTARAKSCPSPRWRTFHGRSRCIGCGPRRPGGPYRPHQWLCCPGAQGMAALRAVAAILLSNISVWISTCAGPRARSEAAWAGRALGAAGAALSSETSGRSAAGVPAAGWPGRMSDVRCFLARCQARAARLLAGFSLRSSCNSLAPVESPALWWICWPR